MITSLSIHNVVLIDKAEIQFAPGLCILSGETGSGKSILLDALGLAIGFRANMRLIGLDENKAQVTADFDISKNPGCSEFLAENDLIDSQNPGQLRIRRTISDSSVNKIFVNDNPIGVNLLAKIGEFLVEVHGQHDQRGLLNIASHVEILDEFSGNQKLLGELKINYENLREVEKKIADLNAKKEAALREKDYLEHVVRELENADVKAGEEDDLVSKKELLIGREKIINAANDLKSHLLEANSQLNLAQKVIIRNQKHLEKYSELSDKVDRQISELDSEIEGIESHLRDLFLGENNLEDIEERLFFIRSLARKFGTSVENLSQIIAEAKHKLTLISGDEKSSKDLEIKRSELVAEYKKMASQLSEKRKKSSKILAQKVEEELSFLKMGGVKFEAEVVTSDLQISPSGADKVRFVAAINGGNFDDISKIASGGELSRFMLALKVALLEVKSVPTMIFDEIDTGIGGSTADAVGKRLKTLSTRLQILVVTHQPQIAAKADNHFKINKIFSGNKAKTEIKKLDENEREQEIARMLSGEQISSEAVSAARSLIQG